MKWKICIDCEQNLNRGNTRTNRLAKTDRCGKCYLKWKEEVRRNKK